MNYQFGTELKQVQDRINQFLANQFEEIEKEVVEVDTISVLGENDIILDIRSPEETDENPFESDEHQVMQLPFYKLSSQFG